MANSQLDGAGSLATNGASDANDFLQASAHGAGTSLTNTQKDPVAAESPSTVLTSLFKRKADDVTNENEHISKRTRTSDEAADVDPFNIKFADDIEEYLAERDTQDETALGRTENGKAANAEEGQTYDTTSASTLNGTSGAPAEGLDVDSAADKQSNGTSDAHNDSPANTVPTATPTEQQAHDNVTSTSVESRDATDHQKTAETGITLQIGASHQEIATPADLSATQESLEEEESIAAETVAEPAPVSKKTSGKSNKESATNASTGAADDQSGADDEHQGSKGDNDDAGNAAAKKVPKKRIRSRTATTERATSARARVTAARKVTRASTRVEPRAMRSHRAAPAKTAAKAQKPTRSRTTSKAKESAKRQVKQVRDQVKRQVKRQAKPAPAQPRKRKTALKARQEEEEEQEEEKEEVTYEVDRILDHRLLSAGRTAELLVLWKGYPRSQATWEPKRNLVDAREAVKEYFSKLEKKQKEDQAKKEAGARSARAQRVERRKSSGR